MSTTLSNSPSTQAVIDQTLQTLAMCRQRFEKTFSFVPDDKLNYQVSETTKTPLRIAAHTALSNYNFANIIRGNMPGQMDPEAMKQMMIDVAAKEAAITTREQALELLAASVADVEAAVKEVNDSTVGQDVPTPFFTAPMPFWMNLPARHMDNHAAQIDYIQTIWGDMDWHMA